MYKAILFIFFVSSILIYGNSKSTTNYSDNAKKIASKPVVTTTPKPTATPTPIPEPKLQGTVYKGLASYYSRAGCLGCDPNFIMRNGEPLDDSKLTVAFNHAEMGTIIKITNVQTRQSVFAEVTDTGGFEHVRIPKIVDLSVATKDAIGCGGTCEVVIEL